MPERVVMYQVEDIETVLSEANGEIGASASRGLDLLTSHIAESEGLEWQEGFGQAPGGYVGMEQKITSRLSNAKPEECRFGYCRAEVSFSFAEGITLKCPGLSAGTEEEAVSFERNVVGECNNCQVGMGAKIVDWLVKLNESKQVADMGVQSAQAKLENARTELDKVFTLKKQLRF
jgi:hypothetical protein